jgi:hypothetical protein
MQEGPFDKQRNAVVPAAVEVEGKAVGATVRVADD